MRKNNLFNISALTITIVAFNSCKSVVSKDNSSDSKNLIESKVDSVLKLMTIEEKVGQLNLINGFWDITGPIPSDDKSKEKIELLKTGKVGAVLNITSVEKVRKIQELVMENSRLKIPLLFGFDVVHGYQTMMPIPLAESCTWDTTLMRKTAEYAALEATSAGLNWTFAPMVDVSRDARWGRGMEGAGEDPYLGSLIAKARVSGFQGDLKSKNCMAACAKHFAAYGFAESGKEYNTTDISESTLQNIVLPPFYAASNALTFMNGFNDLGGTPATASAYLQREILKGKWDYKGFVVSDWGSIGELIPHGAAADSKQAAEIALKAGSDMDMESNCYINHIAELIKEKKVDESILDEAVRRVLRVKFELGLFENPYKYCDDKAEKINLDTNKRSELALEAARKSIVLLKNDKSILPLKKEDKIALIGALALDKDSPLGSWRARAIKKSAVSVEEGMRSKTENLLIERGVKLLNKEHSFIHEVELNTTDNSGINEAVAVAKKVDKVVVVLGEDCFMSGEGRSRTDLNIPGLQIEMLKAVHKVNPNIILVLMNGRPLTLEWESEHVPAIVEAWHLGNESGKAIADVLFGDYNPSGKLTVSFPRNVGQCPIYYNHKNTGRPSSNAHDAGMVFYSHYTDSEKTPLYPFGFGLSYSNFVYSDIKMNSEKMKMEETLEVKIEVRNTSNVDGEEIVQLYIQDIAATETRPVKELKSFNKVLIKAGEVKEIRFQLTKKELGYFRKDGFVTEAGKFKVFIGRNSRDVREKEFELVD